MRKITFNSRTQLGGMLPVVLGLIFLFNAYVWHHIGRVVDVPGFGLWWFLLIFLSTFIFIITLFLVYPFPNNVTKWVSNVASLWFVYCIIAPFGLVVVDVASLLVDVDPVTGSTFGLLTMAAIVGIGVVISFTPRLVDVEIPAKGLKKDLVIVQISDVHLGPYRGKRFFDRVLDMTVAQKPDLVFITGDLADSSHFFQEKMIEGLSRIEAEVFFIIGNHDLFGDHDSLMDMYSQAGMTILRNETVTRDGLLISGVDDSWDISELSNRYDKALAKVDGEDVVVDVGSEDTDGGDPDDPTERKGYSILLVHQPIAVREAAERGFDLVLSGHTHGGQFFPFTMFGKLMIQYLKGVYHEEDTTLHVNQGTGTWGPPVRLGTRSEVTRLVLKAE